MTNKKQKTDKNNNKTCPRRNKKGNLLELAIAETNIMPTEREMSARRSCVQNHSNINRINKTKTHTYG